MCPSSAGSQGLRSIVKSTYSELKISNPGLPMLVRESVGAKAKITARYTGGKEISVHVESFDSAAIESSLQRIAQGFENEGPGYSI